MQAQLHPQTREHLLRAVRGGAVRVRRTCCARPRRASTGGPEGADLFEKVAEEEYFGHLTEQALELGLVNATRPRRSRQRSDGRDR